MGSQTKGKEEQLRREYQQRRRREEAEKQAKQNRIFWSTVISVFLVILIALAIVFAIKAGTDKNEQKAEQGAVAMEDLDMETVSDFSSFADASEVTNYVKLNVTYEDKDGNEKTGDIVLRLYPEVAPATVANFQSLVKSGFYDGLTFHRISKGFMIQGGDPDGDGTGDSGTTIKGEFTQNGFTNNLKHVRGVLSMARGSYSMDSASCQFFICDADDSWLDGSYATFGFVVWGMDTVDGIAGTEVYQKAGSTEKTTPVTAPIINSASFVNLVTE